MKHSLLIVSCLAAALLSIWLMGVTSSLAQARTPVPDARPTPTPDGLAPPSLAAPPAQPEIPPGPDLFVEAIEVIPPAPILNQPVTIKVTIANHGSRDVILGNNFWSDLYIDPAVVPIQLGQDGNKAWGCQSWWVPAGGSYTLTWDDQNGFSDIKTYALYAQVDTDGHVAEEDENNNVLGPFVIQVRGSNVIVHQSHQDFQRGMASGLDLSHPQGVMRRGIFYEPSSEPGVYSPDVMVNDTTGSEPTNVNQVRPVLIGTRDGSILFAAWEDGRNGGVYDRDIYFSRSFDRGITWSPNVRINQDAINNSRNQVSVDLAYDEASNRLYAVWQDGRDGDFDIRFAYSVNNGASWAERPLPMNDDTGTAVQMNPSIAIEPDAAAGGGLPAIYVAWQDKRNGNDDVYMARSADGGLTWGANIFVTDDPQMTLQNQLAPSVDVDSLGGVFVCWEDWRFPGHPEIYCVRSVDDGHTFGIDVPVTFPSQGTSYRVEPSMVVSTTREYREEFDEETQMTVTVPYDISTVHVAWQEGAGAAADIFYAYAVILHDEPYFCPYPYDFCFEDPIKISGFVIDSQYALPPDPRPEWSIDNSWQGQVSLTRASRYDLTWCHADSTITYTLGVYVAWSDAASYDDWRYEIQTRRVASALGTGRVYEACEDHAAGVVNDNVKLYAYRDDPEKYQQYSPAATRQSNPSVFARMLESWGWGEVYVAWDDDRWDQPQEPGTVRNRDVFLTWTGYTPDTGIYISPVLGSVSPSSWYVLSWWGVTQHAGDLLLQTRFGTTLSPPQSDVAANGWTRWTGNPSSSYLGCSAGVGCFYDAPGRHIVGPDGLDAPKFPYMQYKVIIKGYSRLTALSQVTIHKSGPRVLLPLVLRGH